MTAIAQGLASVKTRDDTGHARVELVIKGVTTALDSVLLEDLPPGQDSFAIDVVPAEDGSDANKEQPSALDAGLALPPEGRLRLAFRLMDSLNHTELDTATRHLGDRLRHIRSIGRVATAIERVDPGAAMALDVSAEEARALHRIVRAMHDGHCPSCGLRFEQFQHATSSRHSCPNCRFTVTALEVDAALKAFQPYLKKSLDVFLQWRERRHGS